MPSHTSNWLQPCDRTLFKPLKDYYRSTAQDLMGQFPGIITCRSNFAGIFASAWKKAMTPSNITSGFKSCGIYPFNPQAIPSDAYLPKYLHPVEDISAISTVDNISIPGADNDQGVENVLHNGTVESLIGIKENENLNVHESAADSGLLINVNNVMTQDTSQCLQIMETEMNPAQLTSYNYLFENGFDLACDNEFVTWCALKRLVLNNMSKNVSEHQNQALTKETEVSEINCSSVSIRLFYFC